MTNVEKLSAFYFEVLVGIVRFSVVPITLTYETVDRIVEDEDTEEQKDEIVPEKFRDFSSLYQFQLGQLATFGAALLLVLAAMLIAVIDIALTMATLTISLAATVLLGLSGIFSYPVAVLADWCGPEDENNLLAVTPQPFR